MTCNKEKGSEINDRARKFVKCTSLSFISQSCDCGNMVLFFSAGDVCGLPKQPGMCMGYFQKWFYNSKTGECESFIYGGCQGNANNFKTEEECEEACSGN